MKKTLYLLTTITFLIGCRNNFSPDTELENYYILTKITANNFEMDTTWIDNGTGFLVTTHKSPDTVKYSKLFIEVNLFGKIVAAQEVYDTNKIDKKFFINQIKFFRVFYNQQVFSSLGDYYIQHNSNYCTGTDFEAGYSPIRIHFIHLPELNKKIQFKVEIEDDKGNVFSAVTDSVFVTE